MNWDIGDCVIYTDTNTGEWAKGTIMANVDSDDMRQITIRWNGVQRLYNYHIPSSQVQIVEFDGFTLGI